jgi:hypothetical protein
VVIAFGGCGSGSTGAKAVPVPNVVGTSAARATKMLEHVGLHAASSVRWDGERTGLVLAQSDGAGGTAPRGATISIVVSAHGARVPAVVGLRARPAVALLRRRGFAVTGVAQRGAVVIAQRPPAEWTRPHSSVVLRVATGEAATLAEVEQAFAKTALRGGDLASVRCGPAPQPAAYKCSGYSRTLDYRISEVVTYSRGAVTPWQPPFVPKQKHHHAHHAHGKTGTHAHRHLHGGHGHHPKTGGIAPASTATRTTTTGG